MISTSGFFTLKSTFGFLTLISTSGFLTLIWGIVTSGLIFGFLIVISVPKSGFLIWDFGFFPISIIPGISPFINSYFGLFIFFPGISPSIFSNFGIFVSIFPLFIFIFNFGTSIVISSIGFRFSVFLCGIMKSRSGSNLCFLMFKL